jgi:hypothetical protein
MKKVIYAFQNAVRKVYFGLLRRFVEDEGLILDLENYHEDAILATRFLRSSEIVAIIYSHSPWGTPDAFTNEDTPRGLNERTYDELKIVLENSKYREKIEKIADNMSRWLEEKVIVNDKCNEEINIVYG